MDIRGGKYALSHCLVQWHPNRKDYSVQQFFAQKEAQSIDESNDDFGDPAYYSFAEMRPYLGPTIRIENIFLFVDGSIIYRQKHIAEMESIAYLWHDGRISIFNDKYRGVIISAEDFLPVLNSTTILKCENLKSVKGRHIRTGTRNRLETESLSPYMVKKHV